MQRAIPNDDISVDCTADGDGWSCRVRVGGDAAATEHTVSVSRDELARYAPGHADPGRLVRASFQFLLEQEPRESILRRFELTAIERYFPTYPRDIVSRV
jgi:hypothetical protein